MAPATTTKPPAKFIGYHNRPEVKQQLIAQMRAHREADELVRGRTWESNGHVRGCAIGCLFHAYDHSQFPRVIGAPIQIAYLVDWLFENLAEGHQEWPERVLEAIKPGADLATVYPQWACRLFARRLDSLGEGDEPWRKECREAIDNVRDPLNQASAPFTATWSAWSSAWLETRSMAGSPEWLTAWYAARSAEIQRQADDLIELLTFAN